MKKNAYYAVLVPDFSPEQHLFITNNYFLIFQNICDLSDLFLGELRVDWFSYAPPYSLDIGCT